MTTIAISVDQLVKTYPRGARALDGLSFDVREGTVFGLLGPNGAGKSTAVRILTTLLHPDSGIARVAGHDVVRDAPRVRPLIGLVGQKLSVVPTATVRENVLLQGRLHGLRRRDLVHHTDAVLERLDLTEVAHRQADRCSGGMKRRVDIAMGVVHRPRILFLDEPTTGLDPDIRVRLWDDLDKLVREDGLTILLTTHYLDEADVLADEVAILEEGSIVTRGTPETLKQQLHGDTLHLEFAAEAGEDLVRDSMDGIPGVSDVKCNGTAVDARVAEGASAVPAVLEQLRVANLRVVSVTVSQPTLDDVYLKHTGQRFASGGQHD